ncbi:GNAT family N-acetyltransferase [Pseudoalteromonas sp. Ld20]|uniref:GNAT family N-acetyltransferase n=1 Tax=Pseudoalteromonas sp. Ld20 TaxID=649165 RepID=UPI003868E131
MKIRKAGQADKSQVMKIVERLADFETPYWRTDKEIVKGDLKVIEAYFNKRQSNQYLYVAELESKVVGILFVETRQDFFNNKSLLHISILAVPKSHEGLGIGTKLLKYSEEFARELNITNISLNVFSSNQHARDIYINRGFNEETIFMLKEV